MKFGKMVASAVALTALAATAQAQTTTGPNGSGNLAVNAVATTQQHTVSTTVNDILLLTVSSSSTGLGNPTSVNYGALSGNAYLTATPLAAAAGPNVKVVANRAFEVSITAPATMTAPAGVTKPAGDVEWKTAAGAFAPLGTTAALVLNNATGTVGLDTNLSFQSRWAYERDVPGSYSMILTLTLAAK